MHACQVQVVQRASFTRCTVGCACQCGWLRAVLSFAQRSRGSAQFLSCGAECLGDEYYHVDFLERQCKRSGGMTRRNAFGRCGWVCAGEPAGQGFSSNQRVNTPAWGGIEACGVDMEFRRSMMGSHRVEFSGWSLFGSIPRSLYCRGVELRP